MFNLINQNSLIIVCVLLSIIVSLLIGKQFGYKWAVPSTKISIFLIGGLLFLTSTKNNNIETIHDFNSHSEKNQALLIYVYSDWWLACTAAKPAVSRLETKLNSTCKLLRIDVRSNAGKYLWNKYKVRSVPTFILLNNNIPIWRTEGKIPNANNIREMIEKKK